MMKKIRTNKGFTIVECLIAIAVILIVSGAGVAISQTMARTRISQWDRYEAALAANNALSCFQSAEDIDSFDMALQEVLYADSSQKQQRTEEVGAIEYTADLGDRLLSKQFSKIRSDENGRVIFYTANDRPLVTLSYANNLQGLHNDIERSLKNSPFFNEGEPVHEILQEKTITTRATGDDDTVLETTYIGNTISMTADGEPVFSENFSIFDRYLYDNELCLSLIHSYQPGALLSTFTDAFSIYQVYDAVNGQAVKKDGKNYYLYVFTTGSQFDSVKNINYEYLNGEPTGLSVIWDMLRGKDFDEISEDFRAFYWTYNKAVLDRTYSFSKFSIGFASEIAGDMIYEDFTVNEATASNLAYAVEAPGSIALYNSADELLFEYTGEAGIDSTGITDYGKCRFINYLKHDQDPSIPEGAKKWCNAQTLFATAVGFDDPNGIITFFNNDDVLVRFVYGKSETQRNLYESEKESVKSGSYSGFYTADETGSRYLLTGQSLSGAALKSGQPGIRNNNGLFTLLIETNDQTVTEIFTSCAENAPDAEGLDLNDKASWGESGVIVDYEVATRYYAFTPNNGNLSTYIKVTYSPYAGDISVEPSIGIWLLPKDEIPRNALGEVTGMPDEDLQKKELFIFYRKG